MAQWKKVLVSGSNVHVNEITASSLTNNNLVVIGANGALESSGLIYDGPVLDLTSTAAISGSIFSGSFVGDGANLTGLVTTLTFSDESNTTSTVDLQTQTFKIDGGEGIDTTTSGQTITVSGEDATYTNKGIARFNQSQFSLSSGAVSLANLPTGVVLEVSGTTNEIEITRTNGLVTVGLPDDVTIGGTLTINNDLIINGDLTYLNTTNLVVKDQFILLNSGSSANTDSGFIFGGTNSIAQSGSAMIWDASYNSSDGRLAIVNDLASNAVGNQTPSYYLAGVYQGTAVGAATAQADHPGNIRIENEEIYIYV